MRPSDYFVHQVGSTTEQWEPVEGITAVILACVIKW